MAEYIFIQSPKQISEHNPCGHWHRKQSDPADIDSGEFPQNCWNFAVDIDGFDIALYALGIKYPYDVISLRYHIGTRQWSTKPVWHKVGLYNNQWLAGGAVHGDFDAVMFSCAETTSLEDEELVLANHHIQIVTTNHSTKEIYTAGTLGALGIKLGDCSGKIAVYKSLPNTFHVMILLRRDTGIELQYSHQAGKVFYFGELWPLDANCRDMCIASDKSNGIFYVAILAESSAIKTYKSTDGGITWPAGATFGAPIGALKVKMWIESSTIFIWCHNRLYYSTDAAVSFSSRDKTPPTDYAMANASLQDATVFYLDKLQKTLDYILATPVWVDYPTIPLIDYRLDGFTTVRNSGNSGVYTTYNTFVNRRIVLPVTENLGETWELVQSPLNYYESVSAAFIGEDDPRWKFSPQGDKIPLDPQY